MRLTITYSKTKKRNLVLINNDTYQRETLSERPIRQPLRLHLPADIAPVFNQIVQVISSSFSPKPQALYVGFRTTFVSI